MQIFHNANFNFVRWRWHAIALSWVVILAGGMLFGIARGTVLTGLGEVLGSLILYFAARHAFGSGERPPPKMACVRCAVCDFRKCASSMMI